ncbi:hypothetical protein SprV_0401735000 [Sparganum proliferum]
MPSPTGPATPTAFHVTLCLLIRRNSPPNLLRDTLPQPGETPIFKGITYWQPAMLLSFQPANFFKRTNFSCFYFIRTTTRIPKIEWFFFHSNNEVSVIPSHDLLNQHNISTEELSCPPELLDDLHGIYEEDDFYGIRNRCFRSVLTLNYRAVGQDGEYTDAQLVHWVRNISDQDSGGNWSSGVLLFDADRTEVIVRGKTAYIHKNTISRLKFVTVREELFACVRGSRLQLSFVEVLRCEHTSRYGRTCSAYTLDQFANEAVLLNRVGRHPNIVRMLGMVKHSRLEGLPLIVLEYVDGPNLLEYLRSKLANAETSVSGSTISLLHYDVVGGLFRTDLFSIAVDIAKAMDHLTSFRISHGDLAARNVILTGDLTAKLCDFGLARSYDDSPEDEAIFHITPELLANPPVWHPKSDVWSFGVLLWEIFSLGSTPYPTCATEEAVADRVLSGWRITAPTFVPRQLESLFSHLLSSCWGAVGQPDSRPPFSELLLFLRQLLVLLKSPPAHASDAAGYLSMEPEPSH